MAGAENVDAKVAWEGDSLEVVKAFPVAVRQEIGLDIRRLQQGTMPRDSRPMQSIGKGVFELSSETSMVGIVSSTWRALAIRCTCCTALRRSQRKPAAMI